jgi:sec-independent protein translocase protein TatA
MVAAAGPFGLGPLELGIILLVVLLLFGASRVGELGGSLGKGIREFRRNIKDEDEKPAPAAAATAAQAPPAPAAESAPAGPEVTPAVKCPQCGSLNPVSARHCNQCGASIVAPVS